MDEKRSKAVTEAFVRLHEQGLIYRYAFIPILNCFFDYLSFSAQSTMILISFLAKYDFM